MQFDRSAANIPSSQDTHRRVAWITPEFPPDRGGVSDHSAAMVNALRAAGHDLLVCSGSQQRGFSRLDAELASFGPDLVIVAYTPLGYAPRTVGISPALVLWSIRLRSRLGCQAILLAHETSLALEYLLQNRELKLAAVATAQMAQFTALALSFDSVLFSNLGAQRAWARLLSPIASRFRSIRICSNIPYQPSEDPAAELTNAGYSVPSSTILFFGTGHEAVLFDYLEAAFLALLQVESNAGLVIVGMNSARLREVRPTLANLGDRVKALGYVGAPQVSLWLQVAKLVLAPLIGGISARKGTVMAALQHGRPVVTTRGSNTLDDIPWDEICIFAPPGREGFAAKAALALRDAQSCSSIGLAARAEYEANASASITAARILRYASESSTRAHAATTTNKRR